jgi:hypothetical protein
MAKVRPPATNRAERPSPIPIAIREAPTAEVALTSFSGGAGDVAGGFGAIGGFGGGGGILLASTAPVVARLKTTTKVQVQARIADSLSTGLAGSPSHG